MAPCAMGDAVNGAPPSLDPKIWKLVGSRSAASFAEVIVKPPINVAPIAGVTMNPALSLLKLRYLVALLLSMALATPSPAGESPAVPGMATSASPGLVTSVVVITGWASVQVKVLPVVLYAVGVGLPTKLKPPIRGPTTLIFWWMVVGL